MAPAARLQTIESRRLVGVLAIPEPVHALGLQAEPRGQELVRRRRRGAAGPGIAQVGGDGRVVLRRSPEGLVGQAVAGIRGERPVVGAQLLQHRPVLRGIRDHAHALVVLGRPANHAGAADVDVLDGVREGGPGIRHCLLEGVERHHHQVDWTDAVLRQRRHVLGQRPPGQDAAVDLGVERLHPAVEHLGKAGHLGHVHHLDAVVAEQRRGAAGGEDLHPQGVEPLRELHDPRLVVHADERASHPAHACPSSRMRTRRPSMRSRPSAKSRIASG